MSLKIVNVKLRKRSNVYNYINRGRKKAFQKNGFDFEKAKFSQK